MAQINLGSTPLSDRDHDWFKVMASLSGWSVRSKVSGLLESYVRKNIELYTELVNYSARKHGLTFDEAFHKLRLGESLGEPLKEFPVIQEMEEKLNGLANQ